jgi:hypothetical protein
MEPKTLSELRLHPLNTENDVILESFLRVCLSGKIAYLEFRRRFGIGRGSSVRSQNSSGRLHVISLQLGLRQNRSG